VTSLSNADSIFSKQRARKALAMEAAKVAPDLSHPMQSLSAPAQNDEKDALCHSLLAQLKR
jgi:hypothetical protein